MLTEIRDIVIIIGITVTFIMLIVSTTIITVIFLKIRKLVNYIESSLEEISEFNEVPNVESPFALATSSVEILVSNELLLPSISDSNILSFKNLIDSSVDILILIEVLTINVVNVIIFINSNTYKKMNFSIDFKVNNSTRIILFKFF